MATVTCSPGGLVGARRPIRPKVDQQCARLTDPPTQLAAWADGATEWTHGGSQSAAAANREEQRRTISGKWAGESDAYTFLAFFGGFGGDSGFPLTFAVSLPSIHSNELPPSPFSSLLSSRHTSGRKTLPLQFHTFEVLAGGCFYTRPVAYIRKRGIWGYSTRQFFGFSAKFRDF